MNKLKEKTSHNVPYRVNFTSISSYKIDNTYINIFNSIQYGIWKLLGRHNKHKVVYRGFSRLYKICVPIVQNNNNNNNNKRLFQLK